MRTIFFSKILIFNKIKDQNSKNGKQMAQKIVALELIALFYIKFRKMTFNSHLKAFTNDEN